MRRENTKLQEHQFADWDWVKQSQNTCLLLFEQWKRYLGAQCPGGESVHHDWCAERIITGIGVAIYVKDRGIQLLKALLCCVYVGGGREAEKRGTETPSGPGFSWVSLAGSHVYPRNRHVFCSHLGQVYRQK